MVVSVPIRKAAAWIYSNAVILFLWYDCYEVEYFCKIITGYLFISECGNRHYSYARQQGQVKKKSLFFRIRFYTNIWQNSVCQ